MMRAGGCTMHMYGVGPAAAAVELNDGLPEREVKIACMLKVCVLN